MAIVDKLDYLLETKNQIKEAIKEKGVEVEDSISFRNYTNKIEQLEKVSNCLTENTINDMENVFLKMFKKLPEDVASFFSTVNMTSTINMFSDCINLIELDLSSFNTSNVTQMNNMFYNSSNLVEINLSSFNTSNVTHMSSMFKNCSNLIELNLNLYGVHSPTLAS